MQYEIEIEGNNRLVDIEKTPKGYRFIVDGVEHQLTLIRHSSDKLQFMLGAKMISLNHALCNDAYEIHYQGKRQIATVIDPRKKVLQLAASAGGNTIATQMPGRVIAIRVEVGETVEKGQILATVEAMKMENPLKAPRSGVVEEICVKEGAILEAKEVLIRLADVE